MRAIHRLAPVNIANLKTPGYYADGGCLYLRVAPGGTKGWIFRFGLAGKVRDAGLGAFPIVSLAKARKQAAIYRQIVAAGAIPLRLVMRNAKLLGSRPRRRQPLSNAPKPSLRATKPAGATASIAPSGARLLRPTSFRSWATCQ